MRNLQNLTATELSENLSTGYCSVREIVTDCLNQTNGLNNIIEAWAFLDPDAILAEADKLDCKLLSNREICKTTLLGIPVGVKDIFNTKDMPTQMGSPIWKGFEPGNDARVVHYLRMANALIFGKTVTAEFAVHAPGPTKNPHNVEHTPGTSSSGSAAAVASRMVPLALGTQTAGSIIRPSSYCGIYGLKPSFGLLPRTGVLKTTDTLDTIGGMARCVKDLQLLFETVRVKGRDFPVSERVLSNKTRQSKPSTRPWRIGVVKGPKWDSAEKYAQADLLNYAERLSAFNEFEVEELNLPAEFEQAHQVHSVIYDRTLAYYFQREFEKHTLVSENIYEIISRGLKISLDQYKEALEKQNHLYQIIDQLFENKCDLLLGLSTGGEALKGLDSVDRLDNCLVWTLCGVPALSIPVFKGPTGLPFGAQVVARRYNDFQLLCFGQELEKMKLAGEVVYPQTASQLSMNSDVLLDKVGKSF